MSEYKKLALEMFGLREQTRGPGGSTSGGVAKDGRIAPEKGDDADEPRTEPQPVSPPATQPKTQPHSKEKEFSKDLVKLADPSPVVHARTDFGKALAQSLDQPLATGDPKKDEKPKEKKEKPQQKSGAVGEAMGDPGKVPVYDNSRKKILGYVSKQATSIGAAKVAKTKSASMERVGGKYAWIAAKEGVTVGSMLEAVSSKMHVKPEHRGLEAMYSRIRQDLYTRRVPQQKIENIINLMKKGKSFNDAFEAVMKRTYANFSLFTGAPREGIDETHLPEGDIPPRSLSHGNNTDVASNSDHTFLPDAELSQSEMDRLEKYQKQLFQYAEETFKGKPLAIAVKLVRTKLERLFKLEPQNASAVADALAKMFKADQDPISNPYAKVIPKIAGAGQGAGQGGHYVGGHPGLYQPLG
jgi:hypothetical protein